MLKVCYFLLLAGASAEDYKHHTVRPQWTVSVFLLGLVNMIVQKNNRWVTLTLTCVCFLLLWAVYRMVLWVSRRKGLQWQFGGADVRLIPGMMLVQGWDVALGGVFAGLSLAAVYYMAVVRKRKALPLVPWMAAGCLAAELMTAWM